MKPTAQKQQRGSGTAPTGGQDGGQRDLLEFAGQQPKGTPTRKVPTAPDTAEQEERSDLADIGEAEEQEGVVDGVKEGSAQQDPPPTVPPKDRGREQRHKI